jgi:hypothetical protein
MTTEQTKIEVERAQQLLAARGMDNWDIDPDTGYKYAEITLVNRGDGEIIVLNRSYRVAMKALGLEEKNAGR